MRIVDGVNYSFPYAKLKKMVRWRRRRMLRFLKPEPGAVLRLRTLHENRRDVRRDRDVVLDHRNMVGDAEHETRRLWMLRDKAGNQRVRGHEPRKARMRVVEAR